MPKQIKPKLSKCCMSEFHPCMGTEGTNFNMCDACGKACDPYIAPKKRVKKEKLNEWCGEVCDTPWEHYHPHQTGYYQVGDPIKDPMAGSVTTTTKALICTHKESEGKCMYCRSFTTSTGEKGSSWTATVSLKDDCKHDWATFASNGFIFRRICNICLKDEHFTKTTQIPRSYTWFRRILLVVLGMLLVLAFQRFSFDACQSAIVHTINPLFLH